MELRCFLISYLYGDNALGSGVAGFKSENYPNYEYIRSKIKEDNPTIINIMEVNENDYFNFWGINS